MKTLSTIEKNGTDEMKLSPLCRADCSICNSDHVEEIHQLIALKKHYKTIVSVLQEKHSFKTSPASISRHYRNYKEARKNAAAAKIHAQFDAEADQLALHRTQTASLALLVYQQIEARIKNGSLDMSVSDYERLVKLYHQVLNGDNSAADDMVALFRKASERFGVSLDQPALL